MNKLYGQGPEGAVLALFLEPGNIHQLKEGNPIEIDLTDGPWKTGLPPKIHVVIAYSETPINDAKHFAQLGTDMKIDDRRTAVSKGKRPHCAECKSTIEQLGVWRSDEAPLWLSFCVVCGCVFGVTRPVEGLERKKQFAELNP